MKQNKKLMCKEKKKERSGKTEILKEKEKKKKKKPNCKSPKALTEVLFQASYSKQKILLHTTFGRLRSLPDKTVG